MMKHCFKICLILSLFYTNQCYAQNYYSRAYCVKTALENAYGIKILKDSVLLSQLRFTKGWAGALPIIAFNGSNNFQITDLSQQFANTANNFSRPGTFSNTAGANLNLTYTIFNGYLAKLSYQRLQELNKVSKIALNQQIQSTIANIIEKYDDIIRQQNFLISIDSNIVFDQLKLDINISKKKIGLANETDILQSRIDLNTSFESRLNQSFLIKQLKIDLCNLMAIPIDTGIVISDTLEFIPIDIESIRNKLPSSPQIQLLASQIKLAQISTKQAISIAYPRLSLSTGYGFNQTNNSAGFSLLTQTYGPFVGVTLSVPIYAGGVAKSQLKINKINLDVVQQSYNQQFALAQANIERTYLDLMNYKQQIIIEKNNISLTVELLKKIFEKYKIGVATIIDIEQAQQNVELSRFRLANVSFLAAFAATELARISGTLKIDW